MKIVIKSSAHFILDSVEKRAHYVGETHGISDFGFRILDLTADITTEHQLSVISIQNPKSKIKIAPSGYLVHRQQLLNRGIQCFHMFA
jgi:hypothetical protein